MDDEREAAPGWLPPRAPDVPASRPPDGGSPPRTPFARPAAPSSAASVRQGRTDPLAIASVLFGVAGLIVLTLSLGLMFLLSLPSSIAAWTLGSRSKARVADGRAESGEGIAHAGVVIGLIGIGVGLVAMIVWSVLIASGLSLDEFQRDLERELDRRRAA